MDEALKLIRIKTGDLLFKEGSFGKSFYMIKEGQFEVFKNSDDGELILGTIGPGKTLGEGALITGDERSASARALSEAVVAELSAGAYRAMLSELPTWAQAILENTTHRLKVANELIANTEHAEHRELKTQYAKAEFHERESSVDVEIEKDFPLLPKEIPHQLLSD